MLHELISILVFPGLISAVMIGLIYEGITRKLTARIQSRKGPPLWQPFLDWIKIMTKENITPKQANGFLMTLCPVVSFASAVTAILFIPFPGFFHFEFQGNIFMFLYFLIISVAFLAISGFATASPFGVMGSLREIMQMISYEAPFVVSLITVAVIGSFYSMPFTAIFYPFSIFGFLLGIMGKLGWPPFHIPEAEQEIVEGPFTEYTGPRLGMIRLAKVTLLWVLVSSFVILYLGGGDIVVFFIKSILVIVILSVLKNIFSRLKINQAFRFYWLVVLPLVIIDLVRVLLGLW